GSCEIRSVMCCPSSANTFSSRSALDDSSRKKSSRGKRPFSSFLDWRIGLPTSRVSVRARSSCRATTRSRNRLSASIRCAIGSFAQRGWPARADSYFRRTAALPSAATSAIDSPVAGLWIFIGYLQGERRGLVARRGGEEVVEDRRVVDERCV